MERPTRMLTIASLGLWLAGWSVRPTVVAQAQTSADLILFNGKVLTVDEKFTIAEAVAVRNGRIAAVGPTAEVVRLAGPATQRVDLGGRTLIPGLIDTHSHVHDYAETEYAHVLGPRKMKTYQLDWNAVTTKEDVLRQIAALIKSENIPAGEWVLFEAPSMMGGRGDPRHAQILYDGLNRWELDKASPAHAIVLTLGIPTFNGYLLSGSAMDSLWGKHGKFIERYGRYWIDKQGRPTGHLEPPASRFVLNEFLPKPSPDDLAPLYKKKMDQWLAMGVTTVATRLPPQSVAAFRLLEAKGELKSRIAYSVEEIFGVSDFSRALAEIAPKVGTRAGTARVWSQSVTPTAIDGSGARACSDAPRRSEYQVIGSWWPDGQCHLDIEYPGAKGRSARISGNYFKEWITQAAGEGLRIASLHAAGDGSARRFLDLAEQIDRVTPIRDKRWALDHCALVNPEDVPRLAKLGFTMSCYAWPILNAPAVAKAYGEEVAQNYIAPVKTMLRAGVRVVFENDRDAYVWWPLELFVTRQAYGKVWGPHERLDRIEALRTITSAAAYYVLKEDELGSIEPGKVADLVVLDRDYLTIPEAEISEVRPLVTITDGQIVFVHKAFSAETNLRPAGAIIGTYDELGTRRRSGALE